MTSLRLQLLALAILGAGASSAAARSHIDERRPMSPTGSVRVHEVSGSVKLLGWDRDELRVEADFGAGVEEIAISGGPEALEVRVKLKRYPGEDRSRSDADADLVVHVPAGARAGFELVSADVEISGLAGRLEGNTVSGDIKASGPSKEARLRTVSGGIRLSGPSERAELETVSGDVEVKGAGGELAASTVSGNIDVAGGEFSRLRFRSVSGALRLDGALRTDGSYEMESHSGEIVLKLPASTNASVEATSFSGTISSEFGGADERRRDRGPGSEARFNLGRGGAPLRVRTFSGEVSLRKK
jgi:hypothetical protein